MKARWIQTTSTLFALAIMACGSDGETNGTGGSSSQGGGSPSSTSSASSASSASSGTGGQGGGTGGSAGCADCNALLHGGDVAQACTMGGPPSSSDLWNAFSQCLCVDNCPTECASTCGGAQPDVPCLQCGYACAMQFGACIDDGGTAGCDTCVDILLGTGTLANLCMASQSILADLQNCTCTQFCMAECGQNACAGGVATDACQTCVGDHCVDQAKACFLDT